MVPHFLLALSIGHIGLSLAFKAAVYEHNVTFPKDRIKILSRAQALDVMKDNLQVYSTECKEAAQQGSKIIVFPEYGIYGIGWTRQSITPYLEFVPDPSSEKWNPCDNTTKHNDTDVQHILSCYAKSNNLYIVANIGARQPCIPPNSECPADGHFQFSTNVVYDSIGTFIARYFKRNLDSAETHFDKPSTVNYTVFTTPFGRFGTISTQDILYQDPAVTMIEKLNVTNIVYTSAWRDQLPLMAAIEFHSAYSEGLHINLFAANLHLPVYGYHGSGMYWPSGTSIDGLYYYNDDVVSAGKLLVHDIIPISRKFRLSTETFGNRKTQIYDNSNNCSREIHIYNGDTSSLEFSAVVNHDRYRMKMILEPRAADATVCDGSLCCGAFYEGDFGKDRYALGAFEGMHTVNGTYYLQACIFIKCATSEPKSCGQATKTSSSYMSKMSFSGNFTTKYVYPEVLVAYDGSFDIVRHTWLYQDAILIDVGLFGSPISISMVARDFSRDP